MPIPRPVVLALVAMALLAAPPRLHAEWRPISPVQDEQVRVDGDGTLWVLAHHDEVQAWPLRTRGWPDVSDTRPWTTSRLPPGFRGLRLAVSKDAIYVAGCYDYDGRHTVYCQGRDARGRGTWEEARVAAIGILFDMAVDAAGTVWLGSERGEIFHRVDGEWVKEVAPLPIHCRSIRVAPGGRLWAWGLTRGRGAIFYRDQGCWRVAREFAGVELYPCRFGDDFFIVQVDHELRRFELGRNVPTWSIPLPPGSGVAMDTDETGWVVREGGAARLLAGGRQVPAEAPPFPPARQPQVIDGRLVSCSSTTCWIYEPDETPPTLESELGMSSRRLPLSPESGHPIYGIAILDLAGARYAYLAEYTEPDELIPLGPPQGDRPATQRFGLDRIREGLDPRPIYRTTALAADLNGDGRTDVIVSSMYDGCRVLRNVEDRFFTGWSREAGLRERAEEIVEDTDLLDADGDGDLDVFVCLLQGEDQLFVNNGAAGFRDQAPSAGLRSGPGSVSATAGDLDGDGDTDIVVCTWGHGLRVHENLGARRGGPSFRTHVLLADLPHPDVEGGLSTRNLCAAAIDDLDGDARPDILVTIRTGTPVLLRNLGHLEFREESGAFLPDSQDPTTGALEVLDADNDGDLDVFVGGHGGTRRYENGAGIFTWSSPPDWEARAKRGTPRTTALAAVDIDGDGDMDLLESGDPGALLLHENTAATDGCVTVEAVGPPTNRCAIGARIELSEVAHPDIKVGVREVPGGTGQGSHRTTEVCFSGLTAGKQYHVTASLPCGDTADGTVVAPGRVTLNVVPPNAARRAAETTRRWIARGHDTWNVRWSLLLIASLLVVLVVREGRTALQGPVRFAALPLVITAVVAAAVRGVMADPGSTGAAVSILAGLGAGLVALAVLPVTRDTSVDLLAELSLALQSFDHNQTPRKMLDRFRLCAANLAEEATEEEIELVAKNLANFEGSLLPEFRSVACSARAAGLDTGVGAALLATMARRAREATRLGRDAVGQRRRIRTLSDDADTFVQWMRSLRKEVDALVASSLDELVRQFAASRAQVYPISFHVQVVPTRVRLPEAEAMRVLDVLLENSLRAMQDGLEISLTIETVRRTRAILTFADNGPGIAAPDRERVFERTYSRFPGGSGFGLYSAQRTVRRFGGEIRVAAEESAGARFVLELEAV